MNKEQSKTCKIGILGAGRIGQLHAENISHHLPQFELLAIADPEINRIWAKDLGISMVCENSDEVIHHPEMDAILIASPSHLHLEQIQAACESGKAIFCEKPIALVDDDIESLLKEVDKKGVLLQVGFNRRFDSNFANIQQRVIAGEIGRPHIIRITSRDPLCPPKSYCATSGGIFMDMTIHDFDMARFLSSSEVVEVYATGGVLINPEFEEYNDVDTAVIQMRFANGAFAVIDNSRQAVYGYDQRVEVFGSEGMLIAENQLNHSVKGFSRGNTIQANPKYFFLERYQQAFIGELQAFYEAWLNKSPSPVSGLDALKALEIAKAAQKSLQMRQPIYLDNSK